MEKNLYIDASHPDETRIVLKSKSSIEEYEFEDKNNLNFKNNIYLGTISRVEPSLQAAFVNFGRTKHGFLAFNDIQSDYYQIPSEDKEKIKDAEEKIRENLKNKAIEENSSDKNNEVHNEKSSDKNDDEKRKEYREELKTSFGLKRYRIQEVIKPGQVILIQVIKEERGQKGAALTTFISLAGKYMVLMPNTPKGGGISRKIFNSSDRQKIKEILNQIEISKNMGVIVRTAGANKTKNEIEKDYHNTLKTWEEIRDKALNSNAPSLVYEEGDIIKRTLRDTYDNDTKNVYIHGNEAYQKAKKFMKELMPKNTKNIKEDLSEKLNTIGHIIKLRRNFVGNFDEKDTIFIDFSEEIIHSPSFLKKIKPIEKVLDDIPALFLTETEAIRIRQGQKSTLDSFKFHKNLIKEHPNYKKFERIYTIRNDKIIALIEIDEGIVKPKRIIND